MLSHSKLPKSYWGEVMRIAVDLIILLSPNGVWSQRKETLMCMLKKSLFGLKQAPTLWYNKFDSFMLDHKYNRPNSDYCVFKKFFDGAPIILLFYVDDMLTVDCHDTNKIMKLKRTYEWSL